MDLLGKRAIETVYPDMPLFRRTYLFATSWKRSFVSLREGLLTDVQHPRQLVFETLEEDL